MRLKKDKNLPKEQISPTGEVGDGISGSSLEGLGPDNKGPKEGSSQIWTNGKSRKAKRRRNRNEGKEIMMLENFLNDSNQEDNLVDGDYHSEFNIALDLWEKPQRSP